MIVLQGRPAMPAQRSFAQDGLTAGRRLVYNGPMDLPTTLLYSILSSIVEAALTPSPDTQVLHEPMAMARALPEQAKQGVLQPPTGDGFLTISGQQWPLAPTAQFRNRQNLLVLPIQIQDPVEVVYLPDTSGAIYRVWMLTPSEASVSRPR